MKAKPGTGAQPPPSGTISIENNCMLVYLTQFAPPLVYETLIECAPELLQYKYNGRKRGKRHVCKPIGVGMHIQKPWGICRIQISYNHRLRRVTINALGCRSMEQFKEVAQWYIILLHAFGHSWRNQPTIHVSNVIAVLTTDLRLPVNVWMMADLLEKNKRFPCPMLKMRYRSRYADGTVSTKEGKMCCTIGSHSITMVGLPSVESVYDVSAKVYKYLRQFEVKDPVPPPEILQEGLQVVHIDDNDGHTAPQALLPSDDDLLAADEDHAMACAPPSTPTARQRLLGRFRGSPICAPHGPPAARVHHP